MPKFDFDQMDALCAEQTREIANLRNALSENAAAAAEERDRALLDMERAIEIMEESKDTEVQQAEREATAVAELAAEAAAREAAEVHMCVVWRTTKLSDTCDGRAKTRKGHFESILPAKSKKWWRFEDRGFHVHCFLAAEHSSKGSAEIDFVGFLLAPVTRTINICLA